MSDARVGEVETATVVEVETITVETGTAKESGTTVETRFVDTVWTPTLQVYSAETVLDVLPKLVNNMVRMNRSSKLQAVLTKYQTGKLMKVANLAELKGGRIKI